MLKPSPLSLRTRQATWRWRVARGSGGSRGRRRLPPAPPPAGCSHPRPQGCDRVTAFSGSTMRSRHSRMCTVVPARAAPPRPAGAPLLQGHAVHLPRHLSACPLQAGWLERAQATACQGLLPSLWALLPIWATGLGGPLLSKAGDPLLGHSTQSWRPCPAHLLLIC